MRELDYSITRAKQDKVYCESLIAEFEPYILRTASKAAKRFITKSDDEWSVSLSAFHEAIQSYSFDKGVFMPFAEMVIRRRLSDYKRKQDRSFLEMPVDPAYFGNDSDDEDNMPLRQQVLDKTAITRDDSARLEIEELSSALADYGFSFFDLIAASPKAEKTRTVCSAAVSYLVRNPMLLDNMRRSKTLPIKLLVKILNLPRKVLERHRKYIIAAAEIAGGSYPILSRYINIDGKEH